MPDLPMSKHNPARALSDADHRGLEAEVRAIAKNQRLMLLQKIDSRIEEMEDDDLGFELIYGCLGVSTKEGRMIDEYQNKGRLLYRAAGTLLEAATKICFKYAYPDSKSVKIENTNGQRPKTFGIDCLVGKDAHEIKWRDATTDGDHVIKEHTRAMTIAQFGYKPIRVMFYYPNRQQSLKIQRTLSTLYLGLGGEYHAGSDAWAYVEERTGVDLHAIMTRIAADNLVLTHH